ncbi:RHS repeat domain-containing protein (plasmid) [Arthrobacter sp. G.S.26]|uniref:RHS repeat domain-containing protein n=1 Tax=Arthrobacter sp. G.S.26 TaxID=3433706 RepID=UPI003D7780C0
MALLLATAGPGLAAIPAASTGAQSTIGKLGSRPGATRLPLPINDQISGSVDVGTGNLALSITGLSLPGINGDTPLGVVFNSQSTDTTGSDAGPRWTLAAGAAGTLSSTSSGVLYTAGDGYSALFTPVSGSTTAFTSPAGVKADLERTLSPSLGYKLTSRTSATVVWFNDDGRTKLVEDRNGNDTVYGPATGKITTVTSHKGPSGARSATLTYDSLGDLSGFTQTSGTSTRAVSFTRDGAGNLESFTDFAGKTTDFAYTNSRITTITPPTGGATTITYDTNGKVTRITRANASSGSPGSSVTRIAYPSATQTLVAGPNTDLAVAVATGPRTTYALTADGRVSQATDPEGRIRSGTYTGDFDTLTATQGTGTTSGTTTNTFGANTGESVTKSQSQTGAASQAAYGNTAANTKYLATSSTDDAGNQSLYTYNGAGNALTSSDALAAVATLTPNPNNDGTVTEALAPGNGTNKTKYTYEFGQLKTLTPVTGSSLGARAFTYDEWARPKTATDGRGITLTYTYDAVGRMTGTSFSGTTPAASYTYNDNGQPLTRVDANGTTTFTYDQMGRLTSRVNTAGGGTISYGYDKASNLVSTTDSRGTTTYTFDTSGVMETLVYLIDGVQKTLAVATDDRGRRTDTWLQASPARTAWKAKSHTDYDRSGRVTRVTAKSGEGDTDNTTVMDLSYCYAAGSTAPTCSTTATADRSKIQWVKDNLSGAVTTYTYDAAGRLTKAAITGGTSPTTYNYTYDSRGNRLTANGGTGGSQTFTANAANQISTSGYTYDGAGNLTVDPSGTYAYNGAEQMTSVTKAGTTYNYTYAGTSQTEVLSQTTPAGNYSITYGRTDAQGLPIIEQYKKDTLTAYVEHDPITGEALMLRTSSGMQSLYLYDGTGNPAALVTSAPTTAFSYDYDPYGVAILDEDSGGLGTSQNPYTFKAGIQDRTTGWVKFGQRWYNPKTARWTQQDTLDTPLDPKNANRYAYAANDPINNADPTGQFSFGDFAGQIIGSAAAAVGVGLGVGLKTSVGGWAVGAVGSCLGGALTEGVANTLDGESTSLTDVGLACGAGVLGFAVGGVIGTGIGKARV